MTLAEQFAERVHAFDPACLDAAVLGAAKTCLVDLVAVTLSGSATSATQRLLSAAGLVADTAGESLLFGSRRRASALDAALVNGTAAHAEDFDDFNEAFGGHPSVALLPALLALGEAQGASGRAVLEAYVVGVEVESRLADAVHFFHYERGWHPTATLGVFGAAAGCAHLLGLDRAGICTALAIAASFSSGLKANFGSQVKPLHAGHCNRNGVLAARLAAAGFTANAAALDGAQGFLEVFNGPGHYQVERALVPWFTPPALVSPGISLKQFPCCGSTHSAIYAALELARAGPVAADTVREVLVEVHPRRLPHTDNPEPGSPLEAKFSIQYCVARALVSGRIVPDHFEAGAYAEPEVLALLGKVRARPSERYAERSDRGFAGRVAISTADGRVREAEYLRSPGRGGDNPMTETELWEKFSGCAGRVLSSDAGERAWHLLRRFETLASVRELATVLADGALASPARAGRAAPGPVAA